MFSDEDRISIHAARVGCDNNQHFVFTHKGNFNPRSPSGLRQMLFLWVYMAEKFQSTQPEWAATVIPIKQPPNIKISIHAARVGCDINEDTIAIINENISIHAARVGCDWQPLDSQTLNHLISIHAARVGCDDDLVAAFKTGFE